MGLGNLFKGKRKKRDEQLIEEFEQGKVLQVDNDIDNKQHFQKVILTEEINSPIEAEIVESEFKKSIFYSKGEGIEGPYKFKKWEQ